MQFTNIMYLRTKQVIFLCLYSSMPFKGLNKKVAIGIELLTLDDCIASSHIGGRLNGVYTDIYFYMKYKYKINIYIYIYIHICIYIYIIFEKTKHKYILNPLLCISIYFNIYKYQKVLLLFLFLQFFPNKVKKTEIVFVSPTG
uniref:Uncharacterized protein n=1 Tax=Brassica oleracea TaxID=3712 RepID=A0A3P6F1P2_BRAOL|nr:unnamed protein product [Brassica oleracea]